MCTKFEDSLDKIKVLLAMIIIGIIVSSCSHETYECTAYGNTNGQTSHGLKAQSHYSKKYR